MNRDEQNLRDAFERKLGYLKPSTPVETIRRSAKRGRVITALATVVFVSIAGIGGYALTRTTEGSEDRVVGPGPGHSGQIVFTRWGRGSNGFYVMNGDGSDLHQIVDGGGPLAHDDPAWSPDGTKVAFRGFFNPAPGKQGGVFVTNADGSDMRLLARGGSGPTWSPDGNELMFVEGGTVYRTTVPQQHRGPERLNIRQDVDHADWSPDGKRIAYSSGLNLFLVPVDGGEPTKVPNPSWADVPTHPQWSPDGTEIAVTVYTDMITNGVPDSYVGIVDVESGTMRSLTDGRSPTWSPDGERIAFTRAHGRNQSHIYSINVDGTDERQLTFGDVADHSPDWGPDRIIPTSDEQACLQWAAEVTAEAQVRALRWTGSSQEVRAATVGWKRMLRDAPWFLNDDGKRVERPGGCNRGESSVRTQPRPGEVVYYRLHPDPDKVDRYCGAYDRSYIVKPVDVADEDPAVLTRAVRALAATWPGRFADYERDEFRPASRVTSVTVTDGMAVIDLSSMKGMGIVATTCAGNGFFGELSRTVFQFDLIDSFQVHVAGSCEAFGDFMESGRCDTVLRSEI